MSSRSERLRDVLRSYTLHFDTNATQEKLYRVDNSSTPIPLAELFYEVGDGAYPDQQDAFFIPPSPDEYADAVFEQNRQEGHDMFTDEYREEWRHRALVTWPSLVRDVAFIFDASAFEPFDAVRYDLERDMYDGIDAIITVEGIEYFVDLYVDTPKSQAFLEKKKNGRNHDTSQDHIMVEVDPRDDPRSEVLPTNGKDLKLYGRDHLIDILSKIVTSMPEQ